MERVEEKTWVTSSGRGGGGVVRDAKLCLVVQIHPPQVRYRTQAARQSHVVCHCQTLACVCVCVCGGACACVCVCGGACACAVRVRVRHLLA